MSRKTRLKEDTWWNVFQATMRHLEVNPEVKTEYEDEYIALQFRRSVGAATTNMLDSLTESAITFTKKHTTKPKRA